MVKKKKLAIVVLAIGIVCILLSFLAKKEEYIVSVDTTGGTMIANKVVKDGTTIGELEVPKKDGYRFLYWTLEGVKCNDSDEITKDVHLIAVWEAEENIEVTKYKVTFNTDGGSSIESVEVEEGNVLVKPTEPTKEGYVFIEWQLDGVVFDFALVVSKDMELKAIWKEKDKLTVSFDTDGGSKVSSQVLKVDEVAKKPANPTKNGYKFVEWQLDGRTYDFASKVTKDIKLVAKWEKLITYTVTFDSNSGTKVDSQTVEKDKVAKKPDDPTRSGYKVVEWQLDGKTYDFSSKVTKNIKLIAKWKKLENTTTVKTHTVKFNSRGVNGFYYDCSLIWTSDLPEIQTVETGKTVVKPSNPESDGYNFVEWQLNGKTYDFSTPVKGDLTIDALWERRMNTITLDSNGGIPLDSVLIETGMPIPSTIPKREGYKFLGWQYNGKLLSNSTMVLKDMTLIAKWEKLAELKLSAKLVGQQTMNGSTKLYSYDLNFKYADFEYTYGKYMDGSYFGSGLDVYYKKGESGTWKRYDYYPVKPDTQLVNATVAITEGQTYFFRAKLNIFDSHQDLVGVTLYSNELKISL